MTRVPALLVAVSMAATLLMSGTALAEEPEPMDVGAQLLSPPTRIGDDQAVMPNGSLATRTPASCPLAPVRSAGETVAGVVVEEVEGAATGYFFDWLVGEAQRLAVSLTELRKDLTASLLSEETMVAVAAGLQNANRPANVPDELFLGHFRFASTPYGPSRDGYDAECLTAESAGSRLWGYANEVFVDAVDAEGTRSFARLLIDGASPSTTGQRFLPVPDAEVPTWLVASNDVPDSWRIVKIHPEDVSDACTTQSSSDQFAYTLVVNALAARLGVGGQMLNTLVSGAFDPFPCMVVRPTVGAIGGLSAEVWSASISSDGTRIAADTYDSLHGGPIVAVWTLTGTRAHDRKVLAARRLGGYLGYGGRSTTQISADGSTVAMCDVFGVPASVGGFAVVPIVWREPENRLVYARAPEIGNDPLCSDLALSADGSRLSFHSMDWAWSRGYAGPPPGRWLMDTTRTAAEGPADRLPPELSLPERSTAEATGPGGARVEYVADAHDAVDGPVVPDCSLPSGSLFPLGTTTVKCTVIDRAGNQASGAFDVQVVDTTAPALAVPAALTVDATGPNGALVAFEASASDLVDGSTTVDCDPEPESVVAIGERAVTCTTTDGAGNQATGDFPLVVRGAEDQLTNLRTATALSAPQSMSAILLQAQRAVDRGDTTAARGQLGSFANQARARSGRAVPAAAAESLISAAERIRAVLGG